MSVFRAIRWRYLLRQISDVPKKRLIAVSWIGFAAILLMIVQAIGLESISHFILRLIRRKKARS